MLEQAPSPTTCPATSPVRLYYDRDQGDKAVTRPCGSSTSPAGNQYWASRRRTGTTRRSSATRASSTTSNGREFDLYYYGPDLHMVVLHANGATYWVVNTLLNSLSNETMIAIAKGLKPIPDTR